MSVHRELSLRDKGAARRVRSLSVSGSVLSFHNIRYAVYTNAETQKVILNNISGTFRPGMNAILGPTGSGKTSLLDVLAARKDPQGLAGKVLVDGAQQPANFKHVSGYVVQDDIVMGQLTVRENLEFSAALRLPKSVSKEEREERVDDVIFELGLSRVADSKIGDAFFRGVSGGERKRTNVGMELIIKPSVLFLDEPTTGLDATTAYAVLHLLAKLSKRGRTIIFSIHQPRYSIFALFDQMHLLASGETVYHGPAREAITYFSSIGYECEPHNNPPDFFLDVINGQSSLNRISTGEDQAGTSSAPPDPSTLSASFGTSNLYHKMTEETDGVFSSYKDSTNPSQVTMEYPTSFLSQLYYVIRRTAWCTVRNPVLSVVSYVIVTVFALVVGLLYFDLDLTIEYGIQNRAGATFFIIMQMVMGNINAVEIFIRERVMFLHESASGFYRVSIYFFSKFLCDYIILRLIPATFYAVIVYFMLGLQPAADKYFIFYLTLLAVAFASGGLSIAISASFNIASVATLFLAMSYVLMMLFGGLFVNITTLPSWLQWIQYLSIFRLGINALLVNEMKELSFCDTVNSTISYCVPGTDYLTSQGINYSVWGLWQNHMALFIMGVGFMSMGYIQLRRMPKIK